MSDQNIKAEVICDSVNQFGERITTMKITYPRIIIAEVNTHRMLVKSSASSRAMPIQKVIEKVKSNPFFPSWVGMNQSGMQAKVEASDEVKERFEQQWKIASSLACQTAEGLERLGIHKQITNRILEGFTYVTTIITGTEWNNFFKLRAHPDAQPEFMVLAFRMLEAYLLSDPCFTDTHIPYGDRMHPGLFEEDRIKVAIARCARSSYENFDGEFSPESDIKLYDSLIQSGHMAPTEHVAKAAPFRGIMSGAFKGWIPHRKTIPNEDGNNANLKEILKTKPSWV